MRVEQLVAGLWWWTADDDASSYLLELPDALVVIDPQAPREGPDADRFWRHLDDDVRRRELPLRVVVTRRELERDTAALLARYAGAQALRLYDEHAELPAGLRSVTVQSGVAVVASEAHAALACSDLLAGVAGGLAVAGRNTPAGAVAALLALPCERVLPARGDPVRAGGRAAIEAALAG